MLELVESSTNTNTTPKGKGGGEGLFWVECEQAVVWPMLISTTGVLSLGKESKQWGVDTSWTRAATIEYQTIDYSESLLPPNSRPTGYSSDLQLVL